MHLCTCGHNSTQHDSLSGQCIATEHDPDFGYYRCPCPRYELDDVA